MGCRTFRSPSVFSLISRPRIFAIRDIRSRSRKRDLPAGTNGGPPGIKGSAHIREGIVIAMFSEDGVHAAVSVEDAGKMGDQQDIAEAVITVILIRIMPTDGISSGR